VELFGFSKTKYRIEIIAKNVVYIENQYAPVRSPRFFISVVM